MTDEHWKPSAVPRSMRPEREAMQSHYVSTYCIHGDHESCRLQCKTCGEPCGCSCGHPGVDPVDVSEVHAFCVTANEYDAMAAVARRYRDGWVPHRNNNGTHGWVIPTRHMIPEPMTDAERAALESLEEP